MSTISIQVFPSITALRILSFLDEQSSLETYPNCGSFSHLRIEEYIYSILPIIMYLILKHYFEVHHDVIGSVYGLMLVLHYL